MICACKIEMATFRIPGEPCPHCGNTIPNRQEKQKVTEAPKITHTVELLLPDGIRAMKLLFTSEQTALNAFERLSAAFNSEVPICTIETATSRATINVSTFLSIMVQEYIVLELAHAQVKKRGEIVAERYSDLIDALED